MAKVRGRCEGAFGSFACGAKLKVGEGPEVMLPGDKRPVPKALCSEPGLITSCLFDIQEHPGCPYSPIQ